jgi:hypothetical protein
MRRFLLIASISCVVLALPPEAAVAKECRTFHDYYGPLTASERVPCRSARRVMLQCERVRRTDDVGHTWTCRVLERRWRCRITGEDDDGLFVVCRSSDYRIRWEWCWSCS